MKYFALLAMAIFLSVSGCAEQDHDNHAHPELESGEQLYNHHCAGCHKKSGAGNVIKGIPPVLYSKLSLSDMRKFITIGLEGSEHEHPVHFKTMPKDEARKIIRHVHDLFKIKMTEMNK